MNFGIVGTNFISDKFVNECKKLGNASVVAVYSRAEETGKAFAAGHGIGQSYTRYEKMLESKDIDAVYIASPTMLHKEHAILALKYGKSVLCEKMICASYDEYLELKEAAEKFGGTVIEAMRCDFDFVHKEAAKILPTVGKIKSAEFEYSQYSSRYDSFKKGIILNAFRPEMKNSALADIGIYPLHAALALFGEPKDVSAKSVFLENGFQGSGEAILHYGDFDAKIIYSKIHQGENLSRIVGEGGDIEFDQVNEPSRLSVNTPNGSLEIRPPEGSSNMRDEIAEFIRIATEDKDEGKRLFDLCGTVIKWVDKIYRLSGVNF